LLKALLDDNDGPISYLLKKNNVNTQNLATKVQEQINRLPNKKAVSQHKTSSREANNAMLSAGASLKDLVMNL